MVFLTLSCVEHSHYVLPAEYVHDDHLGGDIIDRPGLGSAYAAGIGLAAGEPLGYCCDPCSLEEPGLGGQEPHRGVGSHLANHNGSPSLLRAATSWHLSPQEDILYPMDGLAYDQHYHHGHHIHLLDIHVLLCGLAGGYRVPCGGRPGVGPVDRHVEAGVPYVQPPQGD